MRRLPILLFLTTIAFSNFAAGSDRCGVYSSNHVVSSSKLEQDLGRILVGHETSDVYGELVPLEGPKYSLDPQVLASLVDIANKNGWYAGELRRNLRATMNGVKAPMHILRRTMYNSRFEMLQPEQVVTVLLHIQDMSRLGSVIDQVQAAQTAGIIDINKGFDAVLEFIDAIPEDSAHVLAKVVMEGKRPVAGIEKRKIRALLDVSTRDTFLEFGDLIRDEYRGPMTREIADVIIAKKLSKTQVLGAWYKYLAEMFQAYDEIYKDYPPPRLRELRPRGPLIFHEKTHGPANSSNPTWRAFLKDREKRESENEKAARRQRKALEKWVSENPFIDHLYSLNVRP